MGIKLSNNANATLAAGINSSATSITVTSGQGARFPTLTAGDYFYATLVDTSNNLEIVKCTARSTDVLTVVRAQESTTARAYSTGDRIEIRITAATFVDATDVTALLAAKQDLSSALTTYASTGVGMRNRIINGAFSIWQRGTSFTSASVNEYSADRFRTEGYVHNSVISRQTFTVGQTDVPNYPTYFCRIASTTTVSAGQYWAFQQRVETPQVMSGSGTYTLSYWVKSTTSVAAGAFTYGIDGVQSTSPALSTTWQKLTATVTITNNESVGYVSIYLVYFGAGKGNITVDIANVQLEYGSTATTFDKRPHGIELALCQRYYVQSDSAPSNGQFMDVVGRFSGTTQAIYTIYLPVTMRAQPAVSIFPAYNYGGGWYANLAGVNNYAWQSAPATVTSFLLHTACFYVTTQAVAGSYVGVWTDPYCPTTAAANYFMIYAEL